MSNEIPSLSPRSLTIGLFAYSVNPSLVFVRVPNERGRWMLTDRCVVEVPCRYCRATIGEPCRRYHSSGIRYGVGTHTYRRSDAREKNNGSYRAEQPYPKLRLRPNEVEAPYEDPELATASVSQGAST